MNTRSLSHTPTTSKYIAPPALAPSTYPCLDHRRGSPSITMTTPHLLPGKTVPTSRSNFRSQSLRPTCPSIKPSDVTRPTPTNGFENPTTDRLLAVRSSSARQIPFPKPTGDEKSELPNVTDGPYKVPDLWARTAVSQRGSLVERVTVDRITPAPPPIDKPCAHKYAATPADLSALNLDGEACLVDCLIKHRRENNYTLDFFGALGRRIRTDLGTPRQHPRVTPFSASCTPEGSPFR